jgi:hypothetical protein
VDVDAAGRVWIAHHYTHGISLLDPGTSLTDKSDDRWLNFDESDGLTPGHSWVEDVFVDSGGKLWFGHGAGASRLDHRGTPFDKSDDVWTTYNETNTPMAGGFIDAIVEDRQGCLWFGAENYSLTRRCGTTWTDITWNGPEGCVMCCSTWPGWVWDLKLDADGNLWVVDGRCGAARWDGSVWYVCDTHDPDCGLPPIPGGTMVTDPGARVAAVDGDGAMWFGTRGRGVARYDRFGAWTQITATASTWLGSDWIEGLDFDTAGHGWFGAYGDGVFEYVPPTAASITVTPAGGGDLTSPDGAVNVSFPPGAVDQSTDVTVRKATAPPSEFYVVDSFDLTATLSSSGAPVTTFALPYTLILNYRPSAAKTGTLALYYWDGAQWQDEETAVVDEARQRVTATPDHMTIFALMGETERVYLPLVLR